MSVKINSFVKDEEKKSFMNKFSNMEIYYKIQDEKKSVIFNAETMKQSVQIFESNMKNSNLGRKSQRKSIMYSSPPRKSFMLDSKPDTYASNSEKTRNIIKTIDLNKYTPDQLLDLTVSVLQKPANYRSVNDIKLLAKATENIKFFQEVSQENAEIHEQICRYMTHKFVHGGEIVFNEGTIGSTFYIILKGSVSVCKYEKEVIENQSPQSPVEKQRTTSIMKKNTENTNSLSITMKRSESSINSNLLGIEKKSGDNIPASPNKKSITPFNAFGERNVLTEVRVLEIGNSFGELALMENKPRAATIKCKENCHFAVLDKQFFLHILKENEQKKLFQHIDFFSNLIIFKHWTYNEVKNLKLHSEILELKRNKFVYKEGDPSDFFYIVKTGEFKIIKELTILSDKDIMDKKIRQANIPKFNIAFFKKNLKEFDLAILMPGEFFGEEELIENSLRKFTVICIHPGSLYSINKKEFFRRVMNDNGSRNHLLSEIREKRQWRSKRLREFIFAHNDANSFLKDLSCHRDLFKDFDIKEIDLLLKTDDFDENAIFPENNNAFDEECKAKFALKTKITNVLSNSQVQNNDYFYLDIKNKTKNNNPKLSLYNYFMETTRKRLPLDKFLDKNLKSIKKTNSKQEYEAENIKKIEDFSKIAELTKNEECAKNSEYNKSSLRKNNENSKTGDFLNIFNKNENFKIAKDFSNSEEELPNLNSINIENFQKNIDFSTKPLKNKKITKFLKSSDFSTKLEKNENFKKIEDFLKPTDFSQKQYKPNSTHFTLPCLENSPLKKIKENMHLFLNILDPLQMKPLTSRAMEKKSGFLSERREYYKNKQKNSFFQKPLEIGVFLLKKNEETIKINRENEGLPLKYRSREIYDRKRMKGIRGDKGELKGFSHSVSIKNV